MLCARRASASRRLPRLLRVWTTFCHCAQVVILVEPTTGAKETPLDSIADGRRRRSADSRRRIIAAMLALIQEGNPNPAAEIVAQRAGVGLRTVFRLFSDIESVCAEMLVPQRQEFVQCFTTGFTAPHGAERVRELFGRLAILYDRRMPMRRAATIRRYTSPSLASGMKELDATINQFLRHQLPDDLPDSAFRLNMLNLLLSYESWIRLRDEQGLSTDDTQATLLRAMDVVLG